MSGWSRCRPPAHGDGLYEAATVGDADERFRWLFETPPESRAAFQPWLEKVEASEDPLFFTVIDKASRQGRRAPDADAHRSGQWRHRDRQHPLGAAGGAQTGRDRGAVPVHADTSSTSSATAATSGSATTATSRRSAPPNVSASSSKACSASIWWSRAKTATRRGTRSSTRNGRRSRQAYEAWLDPGNFDVDGQPEKAARRLP